MTEKVQREMEHYKMVDTVLDHLDNEYVEALREGASHDAAYDIAINETRLFFINEIRKIIKGEKTWLSIQK